MKKQHSIEGLKKVYLWIHPGFSVGAQENILTKEEKELLDITERVFSTQMDMRESAMIVIYHEKEKTIEGYRNGKGGEGHKYWTNLVQRTLSSASLQQRHAELFNHPKEKLQQKIDLLSVHVQFLTKKLVLQESTQVIGIGETPPTCVPTGVRTFAKQIHSELPPIVDLQYTNARKDGQRHLWVEGGANLEDTRSRYPEVIFIPIDKNPKAS